MNADTVAVKHSDQRTVQRARDAIARRMAMMLVGNLPDDAVAAVMVKQEQYDRARTELDRAMYEAVTKAFDVNGRNYR